MITLEHSYLGHGTNFVCCLKCSIEIVLDWKTVRDLMITHAWVDFYPDQKEECIMRMDNPLNVTSRVLISPREGLLELSYERYKPGTPVLQLEAEFACISNFDLFWTDIDALIHRPFSTIL